MRDYSADDIASISTPGLMVEALRSAFQADLVAPVRHHHRIEKSGEPDATLLLMPAWSGANQQSDSYAGVKLVTVVPGNSHRGVATINGVYVLNDGQTGEPVALFDGAMLTVLRTAAASALAADYLARSDARNLTMIGAGAMAPHLIAAHAAIRPIESVTIWNRNLSKAESLAEKLSGSTELRVEATGDLPAAIRSADLVSAATLSTEPLIFADDVQPGTHVDLVGAFSPDMRESEGRLLGLAEVYADTMAGVESEAGDVIQAVRENHLAFAEIKADLFDLARGHHPGRSPETDITVFKSVGAAIEDLAAAAAIHQRCLATAG
ncbi:MAG: ornithine cyclodeaminase family protein [Pseudomonadota bacterium]